MENKYFTISKFAEMANVSRQAVYRRIDKDLKDYVSNENGVMKISVKALKFFNLASEQKETIDNQNVDIMQFMSTFNQNLKIVQVVEKTIQNKDMQIESLLKIIDDMQKTIDKLNDKIILINSNSDNLFDKRKELNNTIDTIAMQKTIVNLADKSDKRKPFFKRLFSRKGCDK